MNKCRNPQYDVRDGLFAKACAACARVRRCSLKDSLEGPEACCEQLVSFGSYNCESCIRRGIGGGCHFRCVFFRQK